MSSKTVAKRRGTSSEPVFEKVPVKSIAPMTEMQQTYLDAIRDFPIVFGIGPAGTGKTYLAMAAAIHYLVTGKVKRIVLVRPAVEAGEKLGFLPGDIAAKFDPYVRPLYDAMNDMLDREKAFEYVTSGIVEVAPLAFMRGRTLNNAFIILDESQNTSAEQMKMFLTRKGRHSKVVVTGDLTQIDLPRKKDSGLLDALQILSVLPETVKFIHFAQNDVVRDDDVQKIVGAYEQAELDRSKKRGATL